MCLWDLFEHGVNLHRSPKGVPLLARVECGYQGLPGPGESGLNRVGGR